MNVQLHASKRAGFTLIEVLVTLILLALLAAAVFPVVTQQVGQGDAPRLANDLAGVKSGIETFNLNVKRTYPTDVEDLANKITTTEHHIEGSTATEVYDATDLTRWDGPYIDAALAAATTDATTGTAFVSGFDADIKDKLQLYIGTAASTVAAAVTGADASDADFVAVRIDGLTNAEFKKLNDLIDGTTDSGTDSGYDSGKLRCPADAGVSCDGTSNPASPAYYLATPFRRQ